jgi:hypothetical protein
VDAVLFAGSARYKGIDTYDVFRNGSRKIYTDVLWYDVGSVRRRFVGLFVLSSGCPLWGLAMYGSEMLRLEDAFPHAGAAGTETLSSLGAAACSLLAKVLLDGNAGDLGDCVLGGLESLGLTEIRPAIRQEDKRLRDRAIDHGSRLASKAEC